VESGLLCNGWPVKPLAGFYVAGGTRQTTGVIVRRNDLIESLVAIRGVGPENVHLERNALALSSETFSTSC